MTHEKDHNLQARFSYQWSNGFREIGVYTRNDKNGRKHDHCEEAGNEYGGMLDERHQLTWNLDID